jgi:hypothetical protein
MRQPESFVSLEEGTLSAQRAWWALSGGRPAAAVIPGNRHAYLHGS